MKKELIKDALDGKLDWFDPSEDLTEEDFRNQIQESIRRSEGKTKCLQPIEEAAELIEGAANLTLHLANLIQKSSKLERCENEGRFDPDVWFNLHEEIGDVIWGIGYLIERYGLDEDMVKQIHRFKMAVNRRRDEGKEI